MAVRIRLQRKGRKQRPFYYIVVADARSPRDGKYIEKLGSYNPMTEPATILLDAESAYNWLEKGAQPSDTVRTLLKNKGVFFKKHLQRGVKKGAMTQDQADTKYQDFISSKDTNLSSTLQKLEAERLAKLAAISGKPKAIPTDDLTKIEGIGPKIAEALNQAGLTTFKAVASSNAEAIKAILDAAEGNFAAHDPSTWSEQADMAAKGEWDKLTEWQDQLNGGKVVEEAAPSEEATTEESTTEEA